MFIINKRYKNINNSKELADFAQWLIVYVWWIIRYFQEIGTGNESLLHSVTATDYSKTSGYVPNLSITNSALTKSFFSLETGMVIAFSVKRSSDMVSLETKLLMYLLLTRCD